MVIKSHISIELEKNNKKFTFLMEAGAPLGEAYDAAVEVLQKIASLSQQAAEKMQTQTQQAEN